MMRGAVALALAVACLAGCASQVETRYFTLGMEPGADAEPSPALRIARVRPAEDLVSRDILIQTSPVELEYYAGAEWIQPPAGLVREKLIAELEAAGAGRPRYELYVDLVRFEQVDTPDGADAAAALRVAFHDPARRSSAEPVLTRTYEATVPAGEAGPEAIARALTRAMEDISGRIAADAAGLSALTGAETPQPSR
jgi:ABC-type uncharacterized transport system auxiliary subunit